MNELTELHDYEAVPGVRFLRAVLLPLGGAGAEREPGDPLPFTLIQRLPGGHIDAATDIAEYQLDHLAKAGGGKTAFTACEEYERQCVRRLLYLRDHPWTRIDVPGWGVATADRVRCTERGVPVPYIDDPAVRRLVSRWEIHLRLESSRGSS